MYQNLSQRFALTKSLIWRDKGFSGLACPRVRAGGPRGISGASPPAGRLHLLPASWEVFNLLSSPPSF
ncbi:MAG: hypothetical protein AAB858_00255, partial [Patescibacteria group bacterium]